MPKLADAWIELTSKDAGFFKGLGAAQKQVEATTSSFNRGTSIMVRSAERPYRAMRRIFNILKEVTKQTDDGKFSVEDADKAWGGLVNQLIASATGGQDTAQVFFILASMMRSLTKDTQEYQLALLGVQRQLLQAAISDIPAIWDPFGMLKKEMAKNRPAIEQQIAEIDKEIRQRNDDLTKRDVNNAQKRIDAAKKESAAKRAEFLSIEDVWKDAQRRMTEKDNAMTPEQLNKARQQVIEKDNARPPDWQRNGGIGQAFRRLIGLEDTDFRPAWAKTKISDEPKNLRETMGMYSGERHEVMDRLRLSDDPKDRAMEQLMEEMERANDLQSKLIKVRDSRPDFMPEYKFQQPLTKDQGDEIIKTLRSIDTEAKKKKGATFN